MTEGEPEQLVDESVRIFRGAIEGVVAEHALDEVMGILKDVLHYALFNPKLVKATVDEYPACIWLAAMLETLNL